MRYRYLTIEREYGSGGTEIARELSKALHIPCYGHEILELTCERLGISEKKIEKYEETVTNSFLFSVFLMSNSVTGRSEPVAGEGQIYLHEQAVIRDLAAKGPAIFLGHCASEALRGVNGVLSVFIRADKAYKRARIQTAYGIDEKNVEATRKYYDKKRANYYYANTARRWDDFSGYDLVLDSGTLGAAGCVAALTGLMR
ncbi:MAG: cytidylate kinase-like family protein [Oscillospiraceae bacterium]|nr:cytidylate kinase-like family protein [Oscillospiraceae bacterium]